MNYKSKAFRLHGNHCLQIFVPKVGNENCILFLLFLLTLSFSFPCFCYASNGSLIRNKDYAFRINIPQGFHVKQGRGPNVKVNAVTNNGESIVVIAKTLSKEFKRINFDRMSDADIQQYIKNISIQYQNTFPGMQIVESKITYLSNHRAAMTIFITPVNSIRGSATLQQFTIETILDGKLFNVGCSAPIETYDRFYQTFLETVVSFWIEDKSWYTK
jgi:hypothetical protein